MAIEFQASSATESQKAESKGGPKKNSFENLVSGLNGSSVSTVDRMFFTEQLALLLETGNSLAPALNMLLKQVKNPKMQFIIQSLIDDVSGGQSFSQALSKHPELFSITYVSLIDAAERGGFMHEVMAELLEMDDRREKLQSTIKSALSYPVFLLSFSLAVVIFVLVVVFPKFGDMFISIADELPLSTTLLMALSQFLIQYWMAVLVGLGAAVFLIRRYLTSDTGLVKMDRLKLSTPIIGSIFTELYLVQSMRVLALSLGNGVSVMDALAACRDVVDNRVYSGFIRRVEQSVQDGKGIANGFQGESFIPDLVQQMVTTGEDSGNLSKVLHRVSGYYERQLEKRLQTVAKAAEPIMLLVMGVVVGVLVSSLILPIFKLSRAVG